MEQQADQVSTVSSSASKRFAKNANGVNPAVQRALDKQLADKIKQQLRQAFKQLDSQSKGSLAFSQIKELFSQHKVRLSGQSLTKLRLATRAQSKMGQGDETDQCDYKQAVRMVDINLEVNDPLAKEWIVKEQAGDAGSNFDAKSYVSQAMSQKSYKKNSDQIRTDTGSQMKLLNSSLNNALTNNSGQQQQQQQDQAESELNELNVEDFLGDDHENLTDAEKAERLKRIQDVFLLLPKKNSKPISVYDYEKKGTLIDKWATNATSLSTITGENDRGYKLAKRGKVDGYGILAPPQEINMISNQGWDASFATVEHKLGTAEYKSSSLAGVKSVLNKREDMYKHPKAMMEGDAVEHGVERPNTLRSRVVDHYIKSVLKPSAIKGSKGISIASDRARIEAVEQIYRLNLDNRIMNNLRKELNERITDESGVVSLDLFRTMFFTYFKGEPNAYQIYNMLLPIVSVYYDEKSKQFLAVNDPNATEDKKACRIQLLTEFIDLFNYYPVQVNKLRYKNDSNELTYIMSSNKRGTLDEGGKRVFEEKESKDAEEVYLKKLLQLVSDKIRERFNSFQHCFRTLDLDHTQSLGLNEFAQAIEHMRLKLSFSDVTKLFRYLDKTGDGVIGYGEFTMLLEEKWRDIDPYEQQKAGLAARMGKSNIERTPENQQKATYGLERTTGLNIYQDCATDQDMLAKLESMAVDRQRIPIKNKEGDKFNFKKTNINHSWNEDYITASRDMAPHGQVSTTMPIMGNVLKHDYLRQSMEQRVQRKALFNEFSKQHRNALKDVSMRETTSSKLRSQSVLGKLHQTQTLDTSSAGARSQKSSQNLLGDPSNDFELRKMGMNTLIRANERIVQQTQQCDYGENIYDWHRQHRPPQQWDTRQAHPSQRAKSNPNLPAVQHQMKDHGSAYQEAVKFTVASSNDYKNAQMSLLMASNQHAQRKIDVDKTSVMSKEDRAGALKNFYDQKRMMTGSVKERNSLLRSEMQNKAFVNKPPNMRSGGSASQQKSIFKKNQHQIVA